jgi:hypothetical protein
VPHQSFGTVRVGAERAPITFDFGMYGEETFTIIPEPSLGDTFDVYDAPEPTPHNQLEASRTLAKFIRRMLRPEDRPRFDAALYRIPATQVHIIIDCAMWITEQIVPFVSPPPVSSSPGRRRSGTASRTPAGGKRR